MMGQQSRKESLFYYFRLEDQIPESHLLRLIDCYVDFTFVQDRLKRAAANGGESIKDVERERAERHISLVAQVDRGAVSVEDADRGERI